MPPVSYAARLQALVAKAHGLSDPDDVLALQVLELDRRERASHHLSPGSLSHRASATDRLRHPVKQAAPSDSIENLDVFVSTPGRGRGAAADICVATNLPAT